MAATSYIGLHWFCRISKQMLPSAYTAQTVGCQTTFPQLRHQILMLTWSEGDGGEEGKEILLFG